MYDITNADSFARAKSWARMPPRAPRPHTRAPFRAPPAHTLNIAPQVRELQRQGNAALVMALAGNKGDLEEKRAVGAEEAGAYAEQNGLFFLETSAKAGTNVAELFYEVARKARRVRAGVAGSRLGGGRE